jgi:hypothetical protein
MYFGKQVKPSKFVCSRDSEISHLWRDAAIFFSLGNKFTEFYLILRGRVRVKTAISKCGKVDNTVCSEKKASQMCTT